MVTHAYPKFVRSSRLARLLPVILVMLLGVLGINERLATAQSGGAWYVAPTGTSNGDGTLQSPLDLATALGASSPAQPGDTIWLGGGLYSGNFTSYLTGTATAPIVVRQMPGERATLDSGASLQRSSPALTVWGADAWYWGFEVTDTSVNRLTGGGYSSNLRPTSINVFGPRTKFINMVVHDGEMGFGFWSPAVDAELYGNLIYHVGIEGTDRGHGHSIYVANTTGTKRIVDNIAFNSFSMGIQAYTEGGRIDGIEMEGNTLFNHGVMSISGGAKANIYMGGGDDPDRPVIANNFLYYSPFDSEGRNIDVRPSCFQGRVSGNVAWGGTALSLYCDAATTVYDNVFAGRIATDVTYSNNTYYTSPPAGVRTLVRPNRYEPGRANITIFNGDNLGAVTVDLSQTGLAVGDAFEVRDAQNFFGPPVVSGTYSGSPISLPMQGLTIVRPVGNAPIIPNHTTAEFGAFIVRRMAGGAHPPGAPRNLRVAP
jgi:hypothetical protein